eukprot:gene3988-4989_t
MEELIPTLVVIGFQKSGKSSLFHHLVNHSKKKIAYIFDTDPLPESVLLNTKQHQVLIDQLAISLPNGSVCCTLEENNLAKYILTTNFEAFVFISNSYESTFLIELLSCIDEGNLAKLANKIQMGNIICVVDTSSILEDIKSKQVLGDRFQGLDLCCSTDVKCTSSIGSSSILCQQVDECCQQDGSCTNIPSNKLNATIIDDVDEDLDTTDDCCKGGICTKSATSSSNTVLETTTIKKNDNDTNDNCCKGGVCNKKEDECCSAVDNEDEMECCKDDQCKIGSKRNSTCCSSTGEDFGLVKESEKGIAVLLFDQTDLISNEDLEFIKKLFGLISTSKIIITSHCRVNIDELFEPSLNIRDHVEISAERKGVKIFKYYQRKPFHPERLFNFVYNSKNNKQQQSSTQNVRPQLNKSNFKGVLYISGVFWLASDMENSFIFELMSGHDSLGLGKFWSAIDESKWPEPIRNQIEREIKLFEYQDRKIELSIIGLTDDGYNQDLLVEQLNKCLLTDDEIARGPNEWTTFENHFQSILKEDECDSSSDISIVGIYNLEYVDSYFYQEGCKAIQAVKFESKNETLFPLQVNCVQYFDSFSNSGCGSEIDFDGRFQLIQVQLSRIPLGTTSISISITDSQGISSTLPYTTFVCEKGPQEFDITISKFRFVTQNPATICYIRSASVFDYNNYQIFIEFGDLTYLANRAHFKIIIGEFGTTFSKFFIIDSPNYGYQQPLNQPSISYSYYPPSGTVLIPNSVISVFKPVLLFTKKNDNPIPIILINNVTKNFVFAQPMLLPSQSEKTTFLTILPIDLTFGDYKITNYQMDNNLNKLLPDYTFKIDGSMPSISFKVSGGEEQQSLVKLVPIENIDFSKLAKILNVSFRPLSLSKGFYRIEVQSPSEITYFSLTGIKLDPSYHLVSGNLYNGTYEIQSLVTYFDQFIISNQYGSRSFPVRYYYNLLLERFPFYSTFEKYLSRANKSYLGGITAFRIENNNVDVSNREGNIRLYVKFQTFDLDILPTFQIDFKYLFGILEFTSVWDSSTQSFLFDIFIPANTYPGPLKYTINYLPYFYNQDDVRDMGFDEIIIKSYIGDVLPPIIKSIKQYPSNVVDISSSTAEFVEIGWEFEVEDSINGLKYGEIIMNPQGNAIVRPPSRFDPNSKYFISGNQYLGIYRLGLNISTKCAGNQRYEISSLALVDNQNFFSSTDKSTISPFLHFFGRDDLFSIETKCQPTITDIIPPIVSSVIFDKILVDVGQLNRKVTITATFEDDISGLNLEFPPQIILDRLLPIPLISQIYIPYPILLKSTDKSATYSWEIDLPYKEALDGGYNISFSGITDNHLNVGFSDYYTLKTKYTIKPVILKLVKEFTELGGKLEILGSNFIQGSIIEIQKDGQDFTTLNYIYSSAALLISESLQPTTKPFTIRVVKNNSGVIVYSNEYTVTPKIFQPFQSPTPSPTPSQVTCPGRPECGGPSRGRCVEGVCICNPPYTSTDCLSQIIITEPEVDPKTPTVTTNYSSVDNIKFESLINIIALRELNYDGSILKEFTFPEWHFRNITSKEDLDAGRKRYQYSFNITNFVTGCNCVVNNVILNETIVEGDKDTPSYSHMRVGINMKHYTRSMVLDPDWSLLVDTNRAEKQENSICSPKDKGMRKAVLAGIIVGSVCGFIVLSVILGAIIYRRKNTIKLYVAKLHSIKK